jgi:peptide/nickel transport system permease protein
MIPVLFGISMVFFVLLHYAPGGPKAVYALEGASTEDLQRLYRNLGLDEPIHVQYVKWLGSMLRGDWGNSFKDGRPVSEVVFERVPATLQLMGAALILALTVAVPLGIYSGTRPGSFGSNVVNVGTLLGISIPTFWSGLIFILVFARTLGWLPSGGMQTIGADFSLQDRLLHIVGPAAVLASVNVAKWARYIHAGIRDVMLEDYVRTARSKGLAEHTVLGRHALRNALLPVITLLGLEIPRMLSGAMVTEVIFSWPGSGRLIVESLLQRNHPVLMGNLMLIALIVLCGNLLADLSYSFADPRIRNA